MITSKEVFAKRKSGDLDEAYQMALKLNDEPSPDEWDRKALAWCLISLIKRDVEIGNTQCLNQYSRQLEKMDVDSEDDDVLYSQRKYALSLASGLSEGGGVDSIITSKKVFELRKAGKLDEAYQMALKLNARSNQDDWNRKALAWCLIDLIKRGFPAGDLQALEPYCQQLEKITVDPSTDDVLAGQRKKALLLCDPTAPFIAQAQLYSKQGNYEAAVKSYNKIYPNIPIVHHENFGWDLYKYSKQLYQAGDQNFSQIKVNLNQYLKLQIEKPSLLHSVILSIAIEVAKNNQLNLYVFLNLWGVDNFRDEDYSRRTGDEKKEYPALFESAVQGMSKLAVKNKNIEQIHGISPSLDDAIERYSDNIWLVYYKAKFLLCLNHQDEAKVYCRAVCKAKFGEFWAWELLGDAYYDDRQNALSCYCRALLCQAEDNFTVNLRSKLASVLAELGHYAHAKLEINIYLSLNPSVRAEDIRALISQDWFKDISPTTSNVEFYNANKNMAEELLFSDLPWTDAVIGGRFTKPDKANKPYRTIYIKKNPFILEQSCFEKNFSFAGLKDGDPIQVKGENDQHGKYRIYFTRCREDGYPWDIFPELIGVTVFVNNEKRVYNIIIKRGLEGFIHFDKVASPLREGYFVNIRVSQYNDSQGKKYRIINAAHTDKKPDSEIYKEFSDTVKIPDEMEIGFTSHENIFIPKNLIHSSYLSNGDSISGNAVLNYNKKRSEWSWKAISVKKN